MPSRLAMPVDRISEELLAIGYENHIVEIGGEVRCQGRGPAAAWRIAVERPQTVRPDRSGGGGARRSRNFDLRRLRDFRVLEGRRISRSIRGAVTR